MKDENKTKEQLIHELAAMRQRVAEMGKLENERKRVEETIREREREYRSLVKNIPGMVFRGNPDWSTEIIFNSKEVCGYSDEDFNSQKVSWANIIHPDDKERVFAEVAKICGEKMSIVQEYRILSKDGNIRWVEDHKTSIFTDEGIFRGVEGVVFNITERNQVEEALRESEQKYHSVFENSGTATMIIEEDMTISMANAECEKLTGYLREELERNKKWTEFVVKEDLERMISYHHTRREKGENAPAEYEFRFIDKQGNIKDIFTKVAMIPGTKKSIASLMDITARKRAEEKIRRFPRRLIGAIEEERKAIAQNLHDECGGSLSALRFGLEDLKISKHKGSEKKKIDRLLEIIEKLGENVQKISSDLRPETLDHLGLIPVLEWYIKDLSDRIPVLQINFQSTGFKKRLKPELEIVLYRIIQEGLTNVIKHAKARHVDILLALNYPQIILSIKDDGDGFDEEQEDLTLAGGKKRGIGLWSVRERVASVGGTIHIRSRKGKGTVIRAELPVET